MQWKDYLEEKKRNLFEALKMSGWQQSAVLVLVHKS